MTMRMEKATSRKVGRMAKGFTLVELLVAITIISILATIALVAGRGVQLDAQRSKTRSTIDKIQEVLIARWTEYLTQQVPLKIPDAAFERNEVQDENGFKRVVRAISAREMARVRLLAIRDMQRMELPDRPGDLFVEPIPIKIGLYEKRMNDGTHFPTSILNAPSVQRSAASQALALTFFPKLPRDVAWANTNANEELLFEIIANSMVNGSSALEMFRPSEIADTDSDGFREFIDAWGKPIAFIRWPAGYPFDATTGQLVPSLSISGPTSQVDPFLFDHFRAMAIRSSTPMPTPSTFRGIDALDVNMADWGYDLFPTGSPGLRPWKRDQGLFPLVVSAGPDGEFGINFQLDSSGLVQRPVTPPIPSQWNSYAEITWASGVPNIHPNYRPYLYPDPYHPRTGNAGALVGSITSAPFASDNISNFDESGASL